MSESSDEIEAGLMRTMDPNHSWFDGTPLPALSSMFYTLCKGDNEKFVEACRLAALFYEQGKSDAESMKRK